MNIFEQPTLELEYKKMNRCIKMEFFIFQMKCKFVLYKFTCKFSGLNWRDPA